MEEPKKIVRSGCEASSGNKCFHHKFHFGRSSQLFHHPRRAFHLSFHPLFTDMTRFQLKPRFTQNPCFVSPLRVFPLCPPLQCAGFDSAHASRNMRMFFLFPFPLWCSRSVCSVILTPSTFLYLIQVACQSTCFCAEHLHAQPFYVWPFRKTLVHTLLRFKFKPWFTQTLCFV